MSPCQLICDQLNRIQRLIEAKFTIVCRKSKTKELNILLTTGIKEKNCLLIQYSK